MAVYDPDANEENLFPSGHFCKHRIGDFSKKMVSLAGLSPGASTLQTSSTYDVVLLC